MGAFRFVKGPSRANAHSTQPGRSGQHGTPVPCQTRSLALNWRFALARLCRRRIPCHRGGSQAAAMIICRPFPAKTSSHAACGWRERLLLQPRARRRRRRRVLQVLQSRHGDRRGPRYRNGRRTAGCAARPLRRGRRGHGRHRAGQRPGPAEPDPGQRHRPRAPTVCASEEAGNRCGSRPHSVTGIAQAGECVVRCYGRSTPSRPSCSWLIPDVNQSAPVPPFVAVPGSRPHSPGSANGLPVDRSTT